MPYVFSAILGYDEISTGVVPVGIEGQGVYICGILQPELGEIEEIIDQANNIITETRNHGIKNGFDRIKNIDNNARLLAGRKFIPFDVGEVHNRSLWQRLNEKYEEIVDTDVLFDLTLPLPCIYAGIKAYNIHWLRKSRRTRRVNDLQHLNQKININVGSTALLHFSHPHFANQLFPGIVQYLPQAFVGGAALPPPNNLNLCQSELITGLFAMYNAGATLPLQVEQYIRRFLVSQMVLRKYYAFAYVNCLGTIALQLEAATKWVLGKKMDLHTIKDMNSPAAYDSLTNGNRPLNDSIDLRQISRQIHNPLSITDFTFLV